MAKPIILIKEDDDMVSIMFRGKAYLQFPTDLLELETDKKPELLGVTIQIDTQLIKEVIEI